MKSRRTPAVSPLPVWAGGLGALALCFLVLPLAFMLGRVNWATLGATLATDEASAALALSKKILDGETEGYLRFLKAGDSKEVIDIMKDAGVDFTTPAPVQDAMDVFAEQVKELKKCLK